jgi:hypothetical protein
LSIRLSEIVNFHQDSREAAEIGSLVPITVRSGEAGLAIGGQAAIGKRDLAFLMIPLFVDPSPDFKVGEAVGKERERQIIAAYLHDHLAPELMAATFLLETVRDQLESENHPCGRKVEEVQRRLEDPIKTVSKGLKQTEKFEAQAGPV